MTHTEGANNFALTGEASGGGSMENLSQRLVTGGPFDFLSGQRDVDHPCVRNAQILFSTSSMSLKMHVRTADAVGDLQANERG